MNGTISETVGQLTDFAYLDLSGNSWEGVVDKPIQSDGSFGNPIVSQSAIAAQPSTCIDSPLQQRLSTSSASPIPSPPNVPLPVQHTSPAPMAFHPMQTRSKSGIYKPKALQTYTGCYLVDSEPSSAKLALQDPKWKRAMPDEFEALGGGELLSGNDSGTAARTCTSSGSPTSQAAAFSSDVVPRPVAHPKQQPKSPSGLRCFSYDDVKHIQSECKKVVFVEPEDSQEELVENIGVEPIFDEEEEVQEEDVGVGEEPQFDVVETMEEDLVDSDTGALEQRLCTEGQQFEEEDEAETRDELQFDGEEMVTKDWVEGDVGPLVMIRPAVITIIDDVKPEINEEECYSAPKFNKEVVLGRDDTAEVQGTAMGRYRRIFKACDNWKLLISQATIFQAPSVSSMTFLNQLNFSYNNLSGPIPTTNQFQTFNDPSIYEGNPYLCGPPLTTNCSSGPGDTKDKNEEVEEDEDRSEKFWLYIGMALGFIVGYWAVCGTLIIKRSWRHAYFGLVEETKDKLHVFIAVHMARFKRKVARQIDNSIVGPLPTFIGNLSLLGVIDLSLNMINETIPESLGKPANLIVISLKNNAISGQIPLNIGHEITNMVFLELFGNLLNGSIPSSMTEMKELIFLDLSSNYLSGTIPSKWHSLKLLTYMDLSNNSFSGGIPSTICSMPALQWLKLGSKNLSEELSLSLQDCTGLSYLDLGGNRFFGTIQPIVENLFNMSYIGLRSNMLIGDIPEFFCQFPHLHILDLAHNNLSGPIPRCLGNLGALKFTVIFNRSEYTDLFQPFLEHLESYNFFRGTPIPKFISSLKNLTHLDLFQASFTGLVPSTLGNLSQLEYLDLGTYQFASGIRFEVGF
ncbi:hypothetical protein LWI28_026207 [Acer negundo]|uniref:Uncharacterized protein n=1 Tax=Acer negundo TaxID=4023 RepID=A0AAD5NMH1_ACENE|nr:hypothetical protein LWI28_026207 [Acer negundo]